MAQSKLNLSNAQKQEVRRAIDRALEKGVPLEQKYRFLLFGDDKPTEFIWEGKTGEVSNITLPFQTIEQVDEPRDEKIRKIQSELLDTSTGRQKTGWSNKLIWGDNKLILASLKNGQLRNEIQKAGGLKLIYIDPPFDVGANFNIECKVGGAEFTKAPTRLEEVAYRDTWGKGADSFIAMLYERLKLMRDLLAEDGSIYVHCDYRVNAYIRLVMDEVFGKKNFRNEIVWHYKSFHGQVSRYFPRKHDSILFVQKSANSYFNLMRDEDLPIEEMIDYKNWKKYIVNGDEIRGANMPTDVRFKRNIDKFKKVHGRYPLENDVVYKFQSQPVDDVWDISYIDPKDKKERLGYPTQKPEKLIERIIKASSNEGDLVADFFCGSGTTAAVAERLNRRWICSDLGKFAIHTTRKRMINIQRELKHKEQNYRAFEILNLGKYQRESYIGINPNLPEEEKQKQADAKHGEFIRLILNAYSAMPAKNSKMFQGKKSDRMVAIGPATAPVDRLFIDEVIKECRATGITGVDVLAFDFEMGLNPHAQQEAQQQGVDIALKYIPQDVFDKRAVERGEVKFYDIPYIDAKVIPVGSSRIKVELRAFSSNYSQAVVGEVIEKLGNGKSKLAVEAGELVEYKKDSRGIVSINPIATKWQDWIDYWAVDFDFESNKECRRNAKGEQEWTGDYIFENEWQDFRTKQHSQLEFTSASKEIPNRKDVKVAVKVVDILGNDTIKVIPFGFGSR